MDGWIGDELGGLVGWLVRHMNGWQTHTPRCGLRYYLSTDTRHGSVRATCKTKSNKEAKCSWDIETMDDEYKDEDDTLGSDTSIHPAHT